MIKKCKVHGDCEHNHQNKCKQCNVDRVQRRRYELKENAVEYLGGKCCKCGYDKCIGALDFHHKDPSEKDFGVGASGYTRSWEKVKQELDKCILVCANCHRELHWELNKDRRDMVRNIPKRA